MYTFILMKRSEVMVCHGFKNIICCVCEYGMNENGQRCHISNEFGCRCCRYYTIAWLVFVSLCCFSIQFSCGPCVYCVCILYSRSDQHTNRAHIARKCTGRTRKNTHNTHRISCIFIHIFILSVFFFVSFFFYILCLVYTAAA